MTLTEIITRHIDPSQKHQPRPLPREDIPAADRAVLIALAVARETKKPTNERTK